MQASAVWRLHVPGIVRQTPVAVQLVVVSMLHRLFTFVHWLSAVQLVPLLLHVPGTIGHCPLFKHAVPVWMLQLPATFGQSVAAVAA